MVEVILLADLNAMISENAESGNRVEVHVRQGEAVDEALRCGSECLHGTHVESDFIVRINKFLAVNFLEGLKGGLDQLANVVEGLDGIGTSPCRRLGSPPCRRAAIWPALSQATRA